MAAKQPSPELASRTIGSLFYIAFGGAWIALGLWSMPSRTPLLAVVALITAALLPFGYSRYQFHKPALDAQPATPDRDRRDRWFHIINAGQWVVILITGNVLANIGLREWIIPAAMFIVGLHFLPLASLFQNPSQYVTGTAFCVLAVVYPFAFQGGPTSDAGPIGAGLILWISALRNLLRV